MKCWGAVERGNHVLLTFSYAHNHNSHYCFVYFYALLISCNLVQFLLAYAIVDRLLVKEIISLKLFDAKLSGDARFLENLINAFLEYTRAVPEFILLLSNLSFIEHFDLFVLKLCR